MNKWFAFPIAVAAVCFISNTVLAQTPQAPPKKQPVAESTTKNVETTSKAGPMRNRPAFPATLSCGCCKEGGASRTSPVLLALDIDKDGVISAAEIRNATQSLSSLDLNGDGKLSRVEMHTQSDYMQTNVPVVSKHQAGVTRDFYVQKILAKYDRNMNGQIDERELSGRMLAVVDLIDSDGDRILTYQELLNLDNQIRENLNNNVQVNPDEGTRKRRPTRSRRGG